MKLRTIIENLDKSEANTEDQYVWDLYELFQELDLDFNSDNIDYDGVLSELKCYWIGKSYCTDTYVGYRAYFLNEELVFCTRQDGRKCSEVFYWVSKEAQSKTRAFLLTLYVNYEFSPTGQILDLEQDYGTGLDIQYTSQILGKKVIYKGFTCDVVDTREPNPDCNYFHLVRIVYAGKEIVVKADELMLPWQVK